MADDAVSGRPINIDQEYLKSPNGILRLVEAALCMIGFICSVIAITGGSAGGFIQFSTISGFLVALAFFLINLFLPNIPHYKPNGLIVEMIMSAIYIIFLGISGIIAAVYGWRHPSIAAASAFSFFGAAAYAVTTVLIFMEWRTSGGKFTSGSFGGAPAASSSPAAVEAAAPTS